MKADRCHIKSATQYKIGVTWTVRHNNEPIPGIRLIFAHISTMTIRKRMKRRCEKKKHHATGLACRFHNSHMKTQWVNRCYGHSAQLNVVEMNTKTCSVYLRTSNKAHRRLTEHRHAVVYRKINSKAYRRHNVHTDVGVEVADDADSAVNHSKHGRNKQHNHQLARL